MNYTSLPVEFFEENIYEQRPINPDMDWIGIIKDFYMTMTYEDIPSLLSHDMPRDMINKISIEKGIKGKIIYIPQDLTFFSYSINKSKSICIGERLNGKYRLTLGVHIYCSKLILEHNAKALITCDLEGKRFDNPKGSEIDYIGSGHHATPKKDPPIKWNNIENIKIGELELSKNDFRKIEIEHSDSKKNIIFSIKNKYLDPIKKERPNNMMLDFGINIIRAEIETMETGEMLTRNLKFGVRNVIFEK